MSKFIKFFTIFTFLFFVHTSSCVSSTQSDIISIDVPQNVIVETVTKLLPMDIETDSGSLNGVVTIAAVNNLRLNNDLISCQLHLIGRDLNIVTKIAGTPITLRVGEMELDFSTDITTRFDKKQRKLMLTPHIKEINKSSDQADGNLGKTLISLLNNKEFPVDLDKIKPIKTKSGNKTVQIKMVLIDAKVTKNGLKLDFQPKVSTAK